MPVIESRLFRFAYSYEFVLTDVAQKHPCDVVEEDNGGRDAEYDARCVKQTYRKGCRRRTIRCCDQHLAPAAEQQKPVCIKHQSIVDNKYDAFRARRKLTNERVDAEVPVLSQRDYGS